MQAVDGLFAAVLGYADLLTHLLVQAADGLFAAVFGYANLLAHLLVQAVDSLFAAVFGDHIDLAGLGNHRLLLRSGESGAGGQGGEGKAEYESAFHGVAPGRVGEFVEHGAIVCSGLSI
ncbi:hypothetical protein D9M70_464260 [compost metagenome]